MLFCDVSLKVLRIFCTNSHLLPKHYLLHILRNYDILSLPDEVYQFYKAFYLRSAHRFYFVLPKYICSISFGCLNVNEKSCVFTKYCFFVKGVQKMYEVFEHLLQSHYKRFAPKLPLKKNKKMQKPLDYWWPMIYNTITR